LQGFSESTANVSFATDTVILHFTSALGNEPHCRSMNVFDEDANVPASF